MSKNNKTVRFVYERYYVGMIEDLEFYEGGFATKTGEYVHINQPLLCKEKSSDIIRFKKSEICGFFRGSEPIDGCEGWVYIEPTNTPKKEFSLFSPSKTILSDIYCIDINSNNTSKRVPKNHPLKTLNMRLKSPFTDLIYAIEMQDLLVLEHDLFIGKYFNKSDFIGKFMYLSDAEDIPEEKRIFEREYKKFLNLSKKVSDLESKKNQLAAHIENEKLSLQKELSDTKEKAKKSRLSEIESEASKIIEAAELNAKSHAEEIIKAANMKAQEIISEAKKEQNAHEKELALIRLTEREMELEIARLQAKSANEASAGIDAVMNELRNNEKKDD